MIEFDEKFKKKYEAVPEQDRGTPDGLFSSGAERDVIRYRAALDLAAEHFQKLGTVKVLDVGCGYGDLSAHVAEQFPDFTYTGVEAVDWIAQHATEKYPQHTILHGGLQDVGGSFDLGFALGVMASVPPESFPAFLQRLRQLCRHGGVVLSFLRTDRYSTDEGFYTYMEDDLKQAAPDVGNWSHRFVTPEGGVSTMVFVPGLR